MTGEQFREILNSDYLPHFPDTKEWVKKQPEDTKTAWSKLFTKIEPQDLQQAISDVVVGKEVIPYRDVTFTTLRIIAARHQYARVERAKSREESSRLRRTQQDVRGKNMGDALADNLERCGVGPEVAFCNRYTDAQMALEAGDFPGTPTPEEKMDQQVRRIKISRTIGRLVGHLSSQNLHTGDIIDHLSKMDTFQKVEDECELVKPCKF